MIKVNKYPLQKIKFWLLTVMILVLSLSACSNRTVQFLESEMEKEELVQLTPIVVQDETEAKKENGADVEEKEVLSEDLSLEKEEDSEKLSLFVYVCGAVLNPGVYEMETGSRVFQAVELAGGFLAGACPEYVNLAMTVTDGQQIYIPDQTDVQNENVPLEKSGFTDGWNQSNHAEDTSGKVNINTADKTELMTITGIGESRAQDILDYRNEHGGFSAIEEIMNVPGIKEATFNKIKDGIDVK